ncbi:hypothetical protein ABI59_11105 [Acidobacteria bacterium Mor1]|nr:hypothetical protein ABI59_11105 [Acidobacteria bacterium Mor1]
MKTARGGQVFFSYENDSTQLFRSERYKSHAAAQNGIRSVRRIAKSGRRFDTRQAKNGSHYFLMVAGNGEIVARSELYEREEEVARDIEFVRRTAPKAFLEDTTGKGGS